MSWYNWISLWVNVDDPPAGRIIPSFIRINLAGYAADSVNPCQPCSCSQLYSAWRINVPPGTHSPGRFYKLTNKCKGQLYCPHESPSPGTHHAHGLLLPAHLQPPAMPLPAGLFWGAKPSKPKQESRQKNHCRAFRLMEKMSAQQERSLILHS